MLAINNCFLHGTRINLRNIFNITLFKKKMHFFVNMFKISGKRSPDVQKSESGSGPGLWRLKKLELDIHVLSEKCSKPWTNMKKMFFLHHISGYDVRQVCTRLIRRQNMFTRLKYIYISFSYF
jgi:hypothetical protein